MQKIALIAAMSENRVIGRDNKLPWHMPADWKNFKRITHGKPFIMGRNSYEAPDKLLSTKKSIILSHSEIPDLCEHCIRVDHLDKALQLLITESEIFILGGQSVFEQAILISDYIYLTIIHAEIFGDAYFPEIDFSQWEMVKDEYHKKDSENPYDYSFREFERITINGKNCKY